MIEVGHWCLWLALALCISAGCLPWICTAQAPLAHRRALGRHLKISLCCVGCCVWVSLLSLVHAFIEDDFAVQYVAANSNSHLPLHYKITAVWSAHEGSLLLWAAMLAAWSVALAMKLSRTRIGLPSLATLAWVNAGVLALILFSSNPFTYLLPARIDGADLNPLLQDIGLIIHPPILYLGYVGMAIPFAIAIGCLCVPSQAKAALPVMQNWLRLPWAFLTLGIALGSWWAYYELGWGGWWFWDPVENASLMPWLSSTALLHALSLAKRHPSWLKTSLLLAMTGFLLSLLGTFLVRSGLIASVHAFAADPTRGKFIFGCLLLGMGACGVVYVRHADKLPVHIKPVQVLQRSGLLAMQVIIVSASCATVLLGTLYPLCIEALFGHPLSVGPPYFNLTVGPMFIVMLVLMGVAHGTRWGEHASTRLSLLRQLGLALLSAGGTIGLMVWTGCHALGFGFGMFACLYATCAWGLGLIGKLTHPGKRRGNWVSMYLAHAGVIVCALGILVVSYFEIEREISLRPGDSTQVGQQHIRMLDLHTATGPNFLSHVGTFEISEPKSPPRRLITEKRNYIVQDLILTETGIAVDALKDVYIALGDKIQAAWGVRIHIKPMVRWIWAGALIMACASIVSLRRKVTHAS